MVNKWLTLAGKNVVAGAIYLFGRTQFHLVRAL